MGLPCSAAEQRRSGQLDCGSANIPMRDDSFLANLNTHKPASYPEFTTASFDAPGY
ncbi:MAG: hypothetical protein ABI887_01565 [Burkholderiales bacterium]